jgi:hypothetical protein
MVACRMPRIRVNVRFIDEPKRTLMVALTWNASVLVLFAGVGTTFMGRPQIVLYSYWERCDGTKVRPLIDVDL